MSKTIHIPLFTSEPLLDFSNTKTTEKIIETVAFIRKNILGKKFPLLIGGVPAGTGSFSYRENPSNINEAIGSVRIASMHDADNVIELISNSKEAKEWAGLSMTERAPVVRKVADKLREQRIFLIALTMLEVGKNAGEADAEICEAIDFAEYYPVYGTLLDELNNATLLSFPGERNEARYMPVGVNPICVSIQPWNFPVAISVGPAIAALVAGYSVIYKPARASSVLGYFISRTFYDAGIPKDVFHFLPGRGSEIADYLIKHPAVNAIAFTGSKEVKASIQKSISEFNKKTIFELSPSLRYEKRAVALESGGKNALIIDSDADMDTAVVGTADSAFGFQGQKCSACSRLIVIDKNGVGGNVYSNFISRLKDRLDGFQMGSPEDFKNKMGPVIDEDAYGKILKYVQIARDEIGSSIIYYTNPNKSLRGHFAPLVLIEVTDPMSCIAQEEIFGPVLAVFCVRNFDEAIDLANSTEFALTGGIYSRNPDHIERTKNELRVGNIYVNKKITGAIVARQPFGGFKQSGGGTKAGGWDYLLSFLDRKAISEDTMRHGIPIENK